MFNWLRRLLHVPVPTFFDREGKEQPVRQGIEELFVERDKLVQDKFSLVRVIQKLPHESYCSAPPCICAKKILREPY